jgi:uncharacterized phage protein (TIGR02218 family)
MREFSPEFQAHIASGATTLCHCWKIIKRNDEVLGFTDHDVALSFDGTDYLPTAGMTPSATMQKAKSNIDTAQIKGWIDDERIAAADIADGQLAGARVELWKVNWRDVAVRVHMRTDLIGEITEKDGVFSAELRSQHTKLNQRQGRLYQRQCNATFGDARCGLDANDPAFSSVCVVTTVKHKNAIVVSGLDARAASWATGGTALWLDGRRKNKRLRIERHQRQNGEDILYFVQDDPGLTQVGDQIRVIVGCNKSFSTCKEKFANQLNFQGFPHIPGEEFILKYPKKSDPMNGAPLYR